VRRNVGFLVLLELSAVGCGAGWRRPAQLAPGPWAPRQQVQVWSEGQAVRWHAVVVGADSISGAPFLQPPECDSCRLALPLARVDSVRVGKPAAGFWKTFGLVVGVPMALLILYCREEACFPKT
jgi:hypothetical protein